MSYNKNIQRVALINFSWMFDLTFPIIVVLFTRNGLSMKAVFFLQMIFSVVEVLAEIPTGYIADMIGRKKCLMIASILHGFAMTVLARWQDFFGFAIYEVLFALSIAFYSGTDVAMIYDSIENVEENKSSTGSSAISKKVIYSRGGETLAAIMSGMLVAYSLNLPIQINMVIAWIPLLIAITLKEPPRTKLSGRPHLENFKYIWDSTLAKSNELRLLLFNVISISMATLLAAWSFQAYWAYLKIPITAFGYIWGCNNFMVIVGALICIRFVNRLGLIPFVLLIGLLPIVGFGGMALTHHWGGIIFGISFMIARGFTEVFLRNRLNLMVSNDIRATVNSIVNFGVRLLFGLFGLVMGWMMDTFGTSYALLIFAGVYIVSLLGLTAPLTQCWKGSSIEVKQELTI